MALYACNLSTPVLRKLRQECRFKVILGYIVRACIKWKVSSEQNVMCSGNVAGNSGDPRYIWDAGLSISWSILAALADPTVCQGHSVCYNEAVSFLC